MKFDPTKPCTTRDGIPVRILDSNRRHDTYTIIAVIQRAAFDDCQSFTNQGEIQLGRYSENDLINIPEKRKVWVCFLTNGESCYFATHERALSVMAYSNLLAIKEVEFTVGEGL